MLSFQRVEPDEFLFWYNHFKLSGLRTLYFSLSADQKMDIELKTRVSFKGLPIVHLFWYDSLGGSGFVVFPIWVEIDEPTYPKCSA